MQYSISYTIYTIKNQILLEISKEKYLINYVKIVSRSGSGWHEQRTHSDRRWWGAGESVPRRWHAGAGRAVQDRDGSGSIENVNELFGGPGESGFAELRLLDSNADGRATANDNDVDISKSIYKAA
jgi:hypothetical protein